MDPINSNDNYPEESFRWSIFIRPNNLSIHFYKSYSKLRERHNIRYENTETVYAQLKLIFQVEIGAINSNDNCHFVEASIFIHPNDLSINFYKS